MNNLLPLLSGFMIMGVLSYNVVPVWYGKMSKQPLFGFLNAGALGFATSNQLQRCYDLYHYQSPNDFTHEIHLVLMLIVGVMIGILLYEISTIFISKTHNNSQEVV